MLDHWDRVGDWSQKWLNLRYVTRFLLRVGADEDAVALHRALVRAGKQSPLTEQLGGEISDALSAVEAVVRARATLTGYLP